MGGPPIHPVGTCVRLRYAKGDSEVGRWMYPFNNRTGVVVKSSYGPGKRNLLVELVSVDAPLVNVPAGHLRRI